MLTQKPYELDFISILPIYTDDLSLLLFDIKIYTNLG